MYEVTKGLSRKFLQTLFPKSAYNYNLRHISCFKMPLVNYLYNENESIAFLQSFS